MGEQQPAVLSKEQQDRERDLQEIQEKIERLKELADHSAKFQTRQAK